VIAFTDGCPGLQTILMEAGLTMPPIADWFGAQGTRTPRRHCNFERKGARFVYDYDLNIPWCHEVRIEDQRQPEEGKAYPACIGGSWRLPAGGQRRTSHG
jgi:hypothetical protein